MHPFVEQGPARSDGGPSLTAPPTPVGPSRWAIPTGDHADEDGVVGVGADMAPATLVDAYRHGIFPWPHNEMPTPWFCPDPRALIATDEVHVSRSLRRTLRRSGWTTTVDDSFDRVMRACASDREEGTWISDELCRAYGALHDLGWAHSVAVWDGDELVGGIYGVLVGGVFTGESMFHRRSDASKVALVELCTRLRAAGAPWLDCQLPTDHLLSMGARVVERGQFLVLLRRLRDEEVRLELGRREVARLAG